MKQPLWPNVSSEQYRDERDPRRRPRREYVRSASGNIFSVLSGNVLHLLTDFRARKRLR